MKKKIKLIFGFAAMCISVFTMFYSTSIKAADNTIQTSECRWSDRIDGGNGYFFFCGYYDRPLHCNCGDIAS
ncbi:hypothetical protein GM418_30970 [Maribellus comscasis]|uniref:Uncharacterized protein n=1 Tax=Maribellus comscasis TaxID=2681766 RepID=A0A6I6K3F8_9BACT|nr:hypothetical protein [Maribellus comscasis]QGY47920.1 hypothetical protein GM418_30970 [Maribellus comscasis]